MDTLKEFERRLAEVSSKYEVANARLVLAEAKLKVATYALNDAVLYAVTCENREQAMKLIAGVGRKALEKIKG